MKASLLLLGLLALVNRSNAQTWNHAHQGDDWEGIGECGHMERQSPIDISEDFAAPIDDRLVVNWEVGEDAPLTMTNLGDTLKIDFSGTAGQRGTLKWQGYTYDLLQVHCHAASEHTWEGAGRDVECHFVHKVKDQKMFAVTGVTFAASHLISGEVAESQWLKTMIDGAANTPNKNDKTTIKFPLSAGINVQSVDDVTDGNILSDPPHLFRMARPVPIDVAGRADVADARVRQAVSSWRDFFHYRGSLTTPPCTQAVMWFVQRRAILVPRWQAKAAFDLFQKPYTVNGATVTKGNFRETQNEQNSQELYKVRMDWTEGRQDPVVNNQQAQELKAQQVEETCVNKKKELKAQQVEETCVNKKKVKDWVIALTVFFPTLFISLIIISLYTYCALRTPTPKANNARHSDSKLSDISQINRPSHTHHRDDKKSPKHTPVTPKHVTVSPAGTASDAHDNSKRQADVTVAVVTTRGLPVQHPGLAWQQPPEVETAQQDATPVANNTAANKNDVEVTDVDPAGDFHPVVTSVTVHNAPRKLTEPLTPRKLTLVPPRQDGMESPQSSPSLTNAAANLVADAFAEISRRGSYDLA